MLSLFTVGRGGSGKVRKHSMRRFDYPPREVWEAATSFVLAEAVEILRTMGCDPIRPATTKSLENVGSQLLSLRQSLSKKASLAIGQAWKLASVFGRLCLDLCTASVRRAAIRALSEPLFSKPLYLSS
jgi:hypothetical protein